VRADAGDDVATVDGIVKWLAASLVVTGVTMLVGANVGIARRPRPAEESSPDWTRTNNLPESQILTSLPAYDLGYTL
jgi:hypothetical protein